MHDKSLQGRREEGVSTMVLTQTSMDTCSSRIFPYILPTLGRTARSGCARPINPNADPIDHLPPSVCQGSWMEFGRVNDSLKGVLRTRENQSQLVPCPPSVIYPPTALPKVTPLGSNSLHQAAYLNLLASANV